MFMNLSVCYKACFGLRADAFWRFEGAKKPAEPIRLRASTNLFPGWPASLRRYYPRQVQNRVFLRDSRGQGALALSQPWWLPQPVFLK